MTHIQGTPEWVTTLDGRQLCAMVLPGRHVVAGRSGHLVPITEPHIVIGEILGLCSYLPG